MENPETSIQATSGSKEAVEKSEGQGAESVLVAVSSGVSEPAPVVSQEKVAGDASSGAQGSPRSLTSTKAMGSIPTGGATATGGVSAPHPKRFSAVNINKKFLEKNTSASGSSQISSASTSSKTLGSAAKPPPPSTTPHSRLVTTKLTALPQPSTTTGPGWSRPASATPPVAPSPGSTPGAGNLPSAPAPHGPPQLPHVGKVIQPQPRGLASMAPATKADGPSNPSSKPVWGNMKAGSVVANGPDTKVQNDFPTAAEVAQSRIPRMSDKKPPASTSVEPAQKQANMEADTFRGVHLDPNTHHWDEEEDNDDFLGGVIEFGDGRQYQIQPTDAELPPDPTSSLKPSVVDTDITTASPPVNKEDRFADDFDRSWPRSRPPVPHIRPHIGPPHPQAASASSTSSLSPQDASRVLFNERSNRLEPYSNSHPRPSNIGDSRPGRDIPPHHNVQLLQKGFERPHSGFPGMDHDRHRRDTVSSQGSEDRSWDRGRRTSNAGQPFTPLSTARDLSGEGGRQLPPHLASLALPPPPPHRQSTTTREPWHHGPPHEDMSPVSVRNTLSPTVTRDSALSDSSPQSSTVPLTDVEDARKAAMHSAAERAKLRRQQEEEEREQQRERAKKKAAELEAKMKAAEEKAAKADAVSKSQQTQQSTPSDIHSTPERAPAPVDSSLEKVPLSRPPSLRPSSREMDGALQPFLARTPSFRGSQSNPIAAVYAKESSWRSKAGPLPPTLPRPGPRFMPSPVVTPVTPLPLPITLTEVSTVSLDHDEGLEEVDFTELGKFVGVEEPIPEEPSEQPSPLRMTGHDRFDNRPEPTTQSRNDTEPPWRRKTYLGANGERSFGSTDAAHERVIDLSWKEVIPDAVVPPSPSSISISGHFSVPLSSPTKPYASSSDHTSSTASFSQTLVVPPGLASQRSPRTPSYREASMSALDDTMSRIKGAMHGMQGPDPATKELQRDIHPVDDQPGEVKPVSPTSVALLTPHKWVPLATRSPPRSELPVPTEMFALTSVELLPEASQTGPFPRIHLPRAHQARNPPPKRNLALFNMPARVRMDNLSWNPIVEGMTTKDYSLNDVLFGKNPRLAKSPAFQSKARYTVAFSQRRLSVPSRQESFGADGPKVHLPEKGSLPKAPDAGAFGRPRGADERPTWRRVAASVADQANGDMQKQELDTTSGSPPPDTGSSGSSLKQDAGSSVDSGSKSRSQRKMPAGAGVAFYRDSYADPDQHKSSVRFIVSSELEDGHSPQASSPVFEAPAPSISIHTAASPRAKASPSSSLTSIRDKPESKSSDGSSDHAPLTPPTPATWSKPFSVKDSPARPPDPEHLKMLWSQTPTNAEVTGINSLEGIADDLPSVPFTLQEVKSEDGETPPPTVSNGPGPSRMSLHDVTRAFQQVPSPPAGSSSLKAPTQPSPLSHPTSTRLPNYPSTPGHPSNMRPIYPGYPSPMMSHSPAPGMMYPHVMAPSPVSGPMVMNGPSPQYTHQMWMPLPGPGGQTSGAVMRPLPSPYPQQYVSYPSPGAPPQMYGPNPPNMIPSAQPPQSNPQGGSQNRGRTPSVMSPVLSHARPPMQMYQSSPVLMHASVMHVQPTYPTGMPGGRGDARSPYAVPVMHHAQPSNHAPSQQSGYAQSPATSYARPSW